jgi:hypothetical protein
VLALLSNSGHHKRMANPEPPTGNRTARISAKVLKFAAATFILSFALAMLVIKMGVYYLMNWAGVVMFASLIVGLLAGIVRVCSSIFAEIQIRMSEMLITLLAAGVFAGIANSISKMTIRLKTGKLSPRLSRCSFLLSLELVRHGHGAPRKALKQSRPCRD